MRNISLSVSAIILLLCVATASAQQAYVYEFLRSESSARAAAMGGSFVTVTNDATAMHYNPALLNTIDSTQASFTFFKHVLDINSGYATFATDIDGIGDIGVGVIYTNYGSFEQVDRLGREVGEFGASDLAFTLGWAVHLGEWFSAGVGAKAVFSSIEEYGSVALALDGGLLFRDTASRFEAGLSILNLGSQVSSYDETSEDLPLDLKFGVSHRLRGLPLLLAVNFHRLLDERDGFFDHFTSFSVGGEFTIADPVRLRLGYNNRVREDLVFGGSKGLAGISAGLGVLVSDYRFDYAFSSLGRVGAQHRISINANF
jgi:hypothetical protein